MEQSFVAWAKMRAHRLPAVKLGIGDDAAVLDRAAGDTVITTDTLMDGVHFLSEEVEPRQMGRKVVTVNLSDLAAMAARPKALFLSMCVPTDAARPVDILAAEIYEGVCQAAEEYGVALAGGDTNCWDGPIVLSLTAVGEVVDGKVWQRSTVVADDLVVVTGPLGGSIEGKHLDFSPRFDLVEALRGEDGIHGAMDISDGLSVDLLRMCDASHLGAILDLERIPVTDSATQLSTTSGKTAVEHALGDGEDFELLLAVAPDALERIQATVGKENAVVVGSFTSRTGLWMQVGGKIEQLSSSGYVHGRSG